MSNVAFSTVAGNPLTAQPITAGKIIVRSSSDLDVLGGYAFVFGTVSAAPDYEALDSAVAANIEEMTAKTFSAISQFTLSEAMVGIVTGLAPGVAAVGDVRCDTNPSDGATLTLGLTDYTIPYRFKDTMAQAYDVKIGATAAATMANLKAALNADGTAGVEYYAGTLANPLVSATVSTAVVTLTDRIACNRSLEWVLTESASNFSKRTLVGGEDGPILFSVPVGQTSAADALTFSNEARDTATLPALMLATSGYVPVNGSPAMYRIYTDNAIDVKFQYSTDLLTWRDTAEGELTLSAGEVHATFSELHEYLRFIVTANANETNTILDARVTY